jgi:hypothetical protein
MEIDEHLKYTLYVSPTLNSSYTILIYFPFAACNSTLAHARVNPWSRAARRTTSCEQDVKERGKDCQHVEAGDFLCNAAFMMSEGRCIASFAVRKDGI